MNVIFGRNLKVEGYKLKDQKFLSFILFYFLEHLQLHFFIWKSE